MEEPNGGGNNSDSDSFESWTVVNKKSNNIKQSPPLQQNDGKKEDDTDTDGVSVISEDDIDIPDESDKPAKNEKDDPPSYRDEKIDIPIYTMDNPIVFELKMKNDSDSASMRGSEEELSDEFISSSKTRSYIHKRNNKLSGLLNMILIGTIVTTTCIAVGHMWGTTDDCTPQMYSSLSKLIYKMQELQHENFMLKSKIRLFESKNLSFNLLPSSYQNFDNDQKLTQNYADLNYRDQINEFLKREKTACECIKEDSIDIISDDITEIKNNMSSQIDEILSINILNDASSSLNSNILPQMSDSFDDLKRQLSDNDDNNKRYEKSLHKRAIPSYHIHNFVEPKGFDDTFEKENSNLKEKTKRFNYPRNNESYLNKKNLKERRKQEKYIRDSENKNYGKFKKEKKIKPEALNIEDKQKYKNQNQKIKDEFVFTNSNEKFYKTNNKFNKDLRKEKYKMKGFKGKKDENFLYKDKPKNDKKEMKDDKKEHYVKEKKYIKT